MRMKYIGKVILAIGLALRDIEKIQFSEDGSDIDARLRSSTLGMKEYEELFETCINLTKHSR